MYEISNSYVHGFKVCIFWISHYHYFNVYYSFLIHIHYFHILVLSDVIWFSE